MEEAGTLPEMEAFDAGHIHNATPFIDMGILSRRMYSVLSWG